MPTYEYKCLECGHRFDVFQKMSEEPLEVCEKCGGAVRRVMSGGSGLIFKGSGFYITDYARKSTSGAGTGEKSSATETKTADTKMK